MLQQRDKWQRAMQWKDEDQGLKWFDMIWHSLSPPFGTLENKCEFRKERRESRLLCFGSALQMQGNDSKDQGLNVQTIARFSGVAGFEMLCLACWTLKARHWTESAGVPFCSIAHVQCLTCQCRMMKMTKMTKMTHDISWLCMTLHTKWYYMNLWLIWPIWLYMNDSYGSYD